MAGFDGDGACEVFEIPGGVRPIAVVALGSIGDYATADPAIVERDALPRERKLLTEVAFTGTWGAAFTDTPSPAD
jgi:hypothetical protein